MPFITSTAATKETYDVIVVGSGAGGGQTAYTLTMDGARVLMLEAGRNYDPVSETPMFQTPEMAPLRGSGTSDKPFGYYDATVDGGWQVPGEPYVQTRKDDAGRFEWWRARMLGGRTNHWGPSRCAMARTTSSRTRATASVSTGRFRTTTSLRITTRSKC